MEKKPNTSEQLKQSYHYTIPKKLSLKGAPLKQVSQNGKKKIKKRKHTEIEEEEQEYIVPEQKTRAEQAYENIQKTREESLAKKHATKSYREKIEEFNKKIATVTEHCDIPKVGPG
jgi:protein FAM32A